MFERREGWIMMRSHTGFVNHWFNKNQTKALCGASHNLPEAIYNSSHGLTCQKCVKFFKIQQLRGTKK